MNTTTLVPLGETQDSTDDSHQGVPTSAIFAAIVGILLIIVVVAIFVGKRRMGHSQNQMRGQNSPSLIYSVTLHGVGGTAFVNSVESFFRESARRHGVEAGRGENEEQREITDKQITGLPSYEESIKSLPVHRDSNSDKTELPPPPPYSVD